MNTNLIRALKGSLITLANNILVKGKAQFNANNKLQVNLDNNIVTINNDNKSNIAAEFINTNDDIKIKLSSNNDNFFIGLDNDDNSTLKIGSNEGFFSAGIKLTKTNQFYLNSGVPVNNILDEDDMSSNTELALVTQQSIKAYVDNLHNLNIIGRDESGNTLYGKLLTGTWNDGDYTLNLAHGVSNALTNERIVITSVNVITGTSIKQISAADVSFPEASWYDNSYVTIQRSSNANSYDVFVFIIYK